MTADRPASSAHPPLHKRSVLTIDDSAAICAMVRRHLDGTEFFVAGQAHGGEEALVQFISLDPDIVLLDLVMPGRPGQEVLRNLRSVRSRSRFVIVSSVGTEDAVRECLEAGADNFLQKPFTRDGLLNVLRGLAPLPA